MTTTVEIINGEKLLAKMRAIPAATRSRIEHVLAEQADEIVEFAQRLAPGPRSGALRRSITWHWGVRTAPGSMSLGQVRATGFGGDLTLTIVAGNNEAYYARWLEFGTVKMAKRPFFFPAYRANRKRAKAAIRSAVRAAAREVAAS